jgi:hypothetical protein
MASNATYANGEPVEQWSKLSHVIGILRQIPWPAAQYRDLRDARRMLAEIEDNVICCFCGVEWGHAPGCALERVVGDG